MTHVTERTHIRPLVGAGLVLGIGLGGFIDGILLHQILQWHNMLSSVTPPVDLVSMKYNMVWDGLFHALTWILCAAGVVMLFRAGRRPDAVWSGRLLAGAALGGWGLFNAVEGLIDHQLLGIHHVHPGDGQLAWDLGFVLLGGLGFMLAGYLIARRGAAAAAAGRQLAARRRVREPGAR
jgi:uncharacterized membrane protein